jgi:hypothetical protein
MKKLLFLLLVTLFVMQGWSQTTPATLPWTCNFENQTENANWIFDNGPCTNQWVIGNAVNSGAITGSSLYISNDNGTTNAYTIGSGVNASPANFNVVIATREIVSSGADSNLLSFDWKCKGEFKYDFFRVFLVDATDSSFVASNTAGAPGMANGAFASNNALAAGSIPGVVTANTLYSTNNNILNGYNGGSYIDITQHVEVKLSMGSAGTVKKLIIVWRNDNGSGQQPPAALDNFSIIPIVCPEPEALAVPAATITAIDAVVEWTAVAVAAEYVIQWKPNSIDSWDDPAVETESTTDNFFTITNLTGSTPYEARVRSVCTPGADSSLWVETNFITTCEAITITSSTPFTEGFEDAWFPATGAGNKPAPLCWTVIDKGFPNDLFYDYWWKKGTTPTQAHSGSGHAFCYTEFGTSSHNDWLITPQIALTGNEKLSFWAMRSTATVVIADEISIFISDEDITLDASGMGQDDTLQGFHRIFNQMLPVGTWQQYEINLNQYSGNRYIAFVRQGTPNGFNLRLDDVEIAELPACMNPTNLDVTDIQPTEATISWTNGNETDANWLLLYKPAFATTYDTLDITDKPYLLQGLNPAMAYNVMVITNCGYDSSENSPVYTFYTACAPISVPWFENCNAYEPPAFPVCWERYNNGTVSTTNLSIILNQSYSAPGSIRFSNSNSLTLVSPVFDVDINTLSLKFRLRREGNASGTFSVGYLTTPADPTSFVALITYDDANATWIEHEFWLEDVPAGIKQFAFRQNQETSHYFYWLDDILISDCTTPANIHTENLAETSTDIVWDDLAQTTSWTLKVSSSILPDPASVIADIFDDIVNGTPVQMIENLSGETTYYVYVKNSCDTTWVSFSITTPDGCPQPTGLTATLTTPTTATLTWDALGMTGWTLKVSSTLLTDLDNNSGDIFDGQISGIPSQDIANLILGTTYYWYVQSNCTGPWADSSFLFDYCIPAPTPVQAQGITNVTFGTAPVINNSTEHETGNYGNYSNLIGGIFEDDATFTVSVTQSHPDGYITKIWVDWNNDLIFDNVTELVAGPTGNVSGVQTLTATVPANTPQGTYRMRVGSHRGPNFGALVPCYAGSFGSYEDYTLQILPLSSCEFPTELVVTDILPTSATVSWTAPANAPANGYQVLVTNSFTPPAGNESNIQAVTTATVNLTTLNPQTQYYVWVRSDCGNDSYSSWVNSAPFTTPCVAITAFPWTESFENGWGCWALSYGGSGTASNWDIVTSGSSPSAIPYDGTYMARFNFYNSSSGTWGIMATPLFNLPANATVSFRLYRSDDAHYPNDRIKVYRNSTPVDVNGTLLGTINPDTSASDWYYYEYPVTATGYQYIVFKAESATGYNVYIDTVVVSAIITCPVPTAVTATAAFDTATVTWMAGDAESEWQVAWKEATASNWNYEIATATTHGLSGLTATANYEVKVRAICGAADTSYWSDIVSFTTLTCNKPTNVEITGTTATTISLTWQAANGENKWNVIWKSTAATSGSAIVENTPATTLTGLASSTAYEVCIVAICAEGEEGGESAEECKSASTTAIHDLTLANSLQLYPNPTTGELRIKNYELQKGDKIEIYNMLGQKQPLTTNHYPLTTINVSHLSAGVYTVKIGGYVGKFVKK